MKTSKIQDLLESVYPVRDQVVPCLLGEPGIGKTQGIHQFAEKHGVKVVTFILSHALPSEVSGIRMPDLESGKLVVLDDAKMASLEDGDILFFDEILEAPQQLWSAVLTLLQDRVLASGTKLPNVLIVAASNKVVTAKQIPPSTRDRFLFVDLSFDFGEWSTWFNERYHVRPVSQVRDMFFKDTGYNILTPRKFTKLYAWGEASGWSSIHKAAVLDAYGTYCYDRLLATRDNMSARQQLVHCCLEIGGFEMPERFETMPIEELAKVLMEDERWPEIEEVLKATLVKEEEGALECTS